MRFSLHSCWNLATSTFQLPSNIYTEITVLHYVSTQQTHMRHGRLTWYYIELYTYGYPKLHIHFECYQTHGYQPSCAFYNPVCDWLFGATCILSPTPVQFLCCCSNNKHLKHKPHSECRDISTLGRNMPQFSSVVKLQFRAFLPIINIICSPSATLVRLRINLSLM